MSQYDCKWCNRSLDDCVCPDFQKDLLPLRRRHLGPVLNLPAEALRDEFAAMVLARLLERPVVKPDRKDAIVGIGLYAYAVANAMMKAREGKA